MSKKTIKWILIIILILMVAFGAYYLISKNKSNSSSNTSTGKTETYTEEETYTDRDKEQTADTTDATTYTVTSGKDITITKAGTYVITGTSTDTTIYIEAGEDDKVQLVLNGLNITNSNFPCIYVKSGDKLFITTSTDSSLSVTSTFKADGDTNTDAVIFSRSDVTLNGTAKLTIKSTDNGISGKDDIKITGGTYNITATSKGIEANDSVNIAGGTITINSGEDAIHAENEDDNTLGHVYISGGTINITAGDDGIHGTSVVQIDDGTITIKAVEGIEGTQVTINGGTISINASDDGINATSKSKAYAVKITINNGTITINMGQGDTDAIDSNGDLYINGGTINITAQSAFDYDGTGELNGGEVTVNGSKVTTLTNQMMGGGAPGGQRPGRR